MPKMSKAKPGTKSAAPRKEISGAALKSSRQVWPAGMEALAKAQQGGVKVFESLLKQGQRFEQKTKQAAADTAAAARGAAHAKAKEMQEMAGGTWDKLEQVFEDRVARALSKLGIPMQNDIQRLADRVDELSDAVNRLLKTKGAAPKPPAARAKKTTRGAKTMATHVARKTTRTRTKRAR